MADDAERYERHAPEVDISDAQKAERMQRVDFCREARTLRRTSRTRGIVVPWLPASMTTSETEEGLMAQYRKRPVVIDAVQLCWSTWNEVCEFLDGIISEENPGREITREQVSDTCGEEGPSYIALTIPTLEGDHTALHGDWIIRGVKGEFYPCKPDIFEATYEPVAAYATEEG